MGYSGMPGVPLIASSPVRHDSPLNLHGLEVTSYQPPWKALSDFALHADLDNNGAVNHTPAFQHLVNQASHHHFSYFSSVAKNKTLFPLFLPFFTSCGLSCPHILFIPSLFPHIKHFFSLLFICVSLRLLLFEFLLLCLLPRYLFFSYFFFSSLNPLNYFCK